jgi:thymidine kinase
MQSNNSSTILNSNPARVELHLVIGPMFAGKTTHLINTVNELIRSGVLMNEILLVNHSSDARYNNKSNICSHDGVSIDSYNKEKLHDLYMTDLNNTLSEKKYLFIDEAQFFTDLYDAVLGIMNLFKKNQHALTIYIFGLDGDFQQKPFNNGSRLLELIPYASSITKLSARCYICNASAAFSKRLIESTEQIVIGGSNVYQPSCFQHL